MSDTSPIRSSVRAQPACARVAAAWMVRSAVLIGFLTQPTLAWSADAGSEQGGELYSIERRNIMGRHELATLLGVLPMDAFGKGVSLQGSYTYHFDQLIAWEVVGGTYAFIVGTGLRDELRNRFEVRPQGAGDLVALLNSNIVFKPLYGKIAWLNKSLLAAELAFAAGPALGFFDDQSRPFGGNVGVSLRLFLGRHFSLRMDVRDYVFVPNFRDVRNHLYLALGVGLTFGFSDGDTEED